MFLRKLRTLTGVFLVVGMTLGGAAALCRFAVTAPAAAADRPGPAGVAGPAPPAAAEPVRQAEAPAAPPRALAPPAGEGARPLQTRMGLINMTRALKGPKKFQALQADLLTRTQQARQKLEALHKEVRKYQADCDDPTTPAGRREESARRIRELRREIEDEQEGARARVTKMSGDAFAAMYREVEEAANRIAKLKGLELVLFYTDAVTEADFYDPNNLQRKMSQPGALVPMIAAPGMDITDAVIDGLNRPPAAPEGPRP